MPNFVMVLAIIAASHALAGKAEQGTTPCSACVNLTPRCVCRRSTAGFRSTLPPIAQNSLGGCIRPDFPTDGGERCFIDRPWSVGIAHGAARQGDVDAGWCMILHEKARGDAGLEYFMGLGDTA